MSYLGIPNYTPISFHEFDEFFIHLQNTFTPFKGTVLDRYFAVFNQDNEQVNYSPLILKFKNNNIEISTAQDEDISLTVDQINLNNEIVWFDNVKYEWKSSGIELLDAVLNKKLNSIFLIGLDYGEIGVSIHGILLMFEPSDKKTLEVFIRTNYDEISIIKYKEDTATEPKIIKECL